MRRLILLCAAALVAAAAALVAALVWLTPGSPGMASPALEVVEQGCNVYDGDVCVIYAGGNGAGPDSWYCNSSFGDSPDPDQCRVTINVGRTVRWLNTGTVPHSTTECEPSAAAPQPCREYVRYPDYPGLFGGRPEDLLNPGDTLQFTFNSPGTYEYYCYVHLQQPYGIIEVVQPAPTATSTQAPAATLTPVSTSTPGTRTPTATVTRTRTPGPATTPLATEAVPTPVPPSETPAAAVGAAAEALPPTGSGEGAGFPWAVVAAGAATVGGAALVGQGLLLRARRRSQRQ